MNPIELPPGDYVEVPKGPLDKPRILYAGMFLFGFMAVLGVVWGWAQQSLLFGMIGLLFACLFGVALAGRFPALFFRRDRR